MAKTKINRFKNNQTSKLILVIFVLLFAAVGGYALYKIFAATPNTGILEAESMRQYTRGTRHSDQYASGTHYLSVRNGVASKRKLTGRISTGTVKGWRFNVIARAHQCRGAWPNFTAYLSGPGVNTKMRFTVKARGWRSYVKPNLSAAANKTFNVTITYSVRMRTAHRHYCNTGLAFDVVQLKPQPVEITNVGSKVKKNKATISATINNHGNDVSYHVEYGTSTSYGTTTASTAMKANDGPKDISVQLSKFLEKKTVYHYRVCADNGGQVDCSGDYTFETDNKGSKKGNGDKDSCKKNCDGGTSRDKGGKRSFKGGTSTIHTPSGDNAPQTSSGPPAASTDTPATQPGNFYSCVYGNPIEQVQTINPDGSYGPPHNDPHGTHC